MNSLQTSNSQKDDKNFIVNLILNNIPIGILQFDSKNNCSYANEYMYNIFGINNKNKHINFCQLFKESIFSDDLQKELNICDNFIKSLQYTESISKIYNKQKSEYRFFLIKRIFLKHINDRLCYMYIFEDIHEKKGLELQLNTLNSKLLNSNTEKSRFILNVSRQIRSPLNGIIGMLTLLQDTQLTINQSEYISMIKECSFNLVTIVNDILDFSKLENNLIKLNIESIDIVDCIKNINNIILPKIYEKGLQYNFTIDNNIPPKILIDQNRLEQIILNLLTNAIKFTNTGKILLNIYQITLQTYTTLKNKYNNNNESYNNEPYKNESYNNEFYNEYYNNEFYNNESYYIRFDIIDTGCGVNEKDYIHLFKTFDQFNNNFNSELYDGTGLGLIICKELLKLMNGFIWLDKSSVNNGSTFSFVISCKNYTNQQITNQQITNQQITNQQITNQQNNLNDDILQNKSVLIIDDNLHNRIAIVGMVTKWGMKAYAFSNKEEGLCYTQLYNFDIGLINYDSIGINFAIDLREQNESVNHDLPLIALTSFDYELSKDTNYFKTYLMKPIKENELKNICIKTLYSLKHCKDTIFDKNQIKILIAEDNPINSKILIKFVEKLGFNNIHLAENGKECVDLYFQNNYDIIFMDIIMPIMNGDIALQKILEYQNIQNQSYKKKPFVIAISAYSSKIDKDKYLKMGFNDFITKPINITDLETIFNNYIIICNSV